VSLKTSENILIIIDILQ